MKASDLFYQELAARASSTIDRAVLIVAFARANEGLDKLRTGDVAERFTRAHLARPNVTRLASMLTRDSRVSMRAGHAHPLRGANISLTENFPELSSRAAEQPAPPVPHELLRSAPFITADYLTSLDRQAELYKAVHVLENSMRSLIQRVLEKHLGIGWWDKSASSQMKRKHDDRLEKEQSRKWLPSRSELGPLYSIDWSDLITLIRKYEQAFLPYIGEIDFMHRYADMGLLRHVIAHNGFVADESEYGRVMLALRDWNHQTTEAIRKNRLD